MSRYLVKEQAKLTISEHFSTLLACNEKFHPARLIDPPRLLDT